jgi:hypothetical protein
MHGKEKKSWGKPKLCSLEIKIAVLTILLLACQAKLKVLVDII